ncbi:hypothetical protein EDF71_104245 [Comamonas sp. JUb58]|nr:hypothetical protein EDF71_104245 [Comamonas sp. JUb58]
MPIFDPADVQTILQAAARSRNANWLQARDCHGKLKGLGNQPFAPDAGCSSKPYWRFFRVSGKNAVASPSSGRNEVRP